MNNIQTVYDAASAACLGEKSEDEARDTIHNATKSEGGCGIAASFNTFSICSEAMGLMPLGSSAIPGDAKDKISECKMLGSYLSGMFKQGIRPKDLVTLESLTNAAATVAAFGGSTNAVMHLLALAIEAGVTQFTIEVMQGIFQKTPVVSNFGPRGNYTMEDLYNRGGSALFLKHLLETEVISGDVMTVRGQTLGELLEDVPTPKQMNVPVDFISPPKKPFREFADLQIGTGNLGKSVLKIAEGMHSEFSGPAICFDSVEELQQAATDRHIKEGSVVVLRYQGPAAKGMPELLVTSSVLKKLKKLALVTDGRMSGVSGRLFMCLHVAPEAFVGGPIALIENGDTILLDAKNGVASIDVCDAEMVRRKSKWKDRELPSDHPNYLKTFCATIAQADKGCVSTAAFPEHKSD